MSPIHWSSGIGAFVKGMLLSRPREKALIEGTVRSIQIKTAGSDVPTASDTLPSAVAAKIATGNTLDAARRLRDAKPGLSDAEAREAVARHCSPLLREAREETVVEGDSRRYGWLAWVAALVIVGSGLAIWLG